MHRNTFIASPKLLLPTLQHRGRADLFFAGQITGVEGYLGNIGTGLLAGWNAARLLQGEIPLSLPPETMLGALCRYVTQADMSDFQPMKSNLGILPPLTLDTRRSKRERALAHARRSSEALRDFLSVMGLQHDVIGQRPDFPLSDLA
jgi:methylenetetrahydrofolate--tRNA-(uracil-5-)-methyltransferase